MEFKTKKVGFIAPWFSNDIKGGAETELKNWINHLQDKYDAMSAATVLCQPSANESFSLVIMESWLCGRPVMVHDNCAVTKKFVIESNGGLYFDNYFEFEKELNYFIEHPSYTQKLGQQGRKYV